jgi:dTDP-4-amino-4,6-dideoxygalactose transaminase
MSTTFNGLQAREASNINRRLAILGGSPIRLRQWPKWPRADASTQRNLLDVLHSSKWSLSGQSSRTMSYERRFAKSFADFCGTKYGVPCGSGTAALTIALQALGIGPGDEVIIPGLTWVACASAVCNVGATPVLVDVDEITLCLSAKRVKEAITSQTRAVMVVHLYSSMAPVKEICALANSLAIPVIEDSSQAHGGYLQGGRTGSHGTIGVFSMQQSKLLTSGEGGACITDDPLLYSRLQQLRADGRVYSDELQNYKQDAYTEIAARGEILGRNLCLSEFQAAILLDRLQLLDVENEHRHRQYELLVSALAQFPGISFVSGSFADKPTHYRICLKVSDDFRGGLSIPQIASALSAELSLPVESIDSPLNSNVLYQPMRSQIVARWGGSSEDFDPRRFDLTECQRAFESCLTLPQWCLLGDESDIADISAAIKKVLVLQRDALTDRATNLVNAQPEGGQVWG